MPSVPLRLFGAGMLRWFGIGVVGSFSILIVGRLFLDTAPTARLVAVFDAFVLVAAAAMLVIIRRHEPTEAQTQFWGAGIGLLIQVNAIASVAVTGKTVDLLYCPFLVVLAAVLLTSRRLLFSFMAIVTLSAGIIAVHLSETILAAFDLIMPVLIAAAVSYVISVGRIKSHERLEQLRLRDRKLATLLQDTLTTLEQRVEQQRQAEEERRAMEDRLRQSHQLESLGVLAGGVAHDMNNILSIITSVASRAKSEARVEEPIHEDLEYILSAARRGAAFTRNLLGFTARRPQRRERVSIHRLLKEVVKLVTSSLPAQVNIQLELRAVDDIVIGDDGQLSQAVLNLCLNAIDAMPHGGTITVSTVNEHANMVSVPKTLDDLTEDTPVHALLLSVADEGQGMDATARARALEPFYSTKDGAHSGLGMSITYGCVVSHGGMLDIDSELGKGTCITLTLPVVHGDLPLSRRPPTIATASTSQRRTVLVVDDEPILRTAACRLIRSLGMQALPAGDGEEALREFVANQARVDVVLLDLTMPGMNGVDCFHRLRALSPALPILLTSGFSKVGSPEALLELPHVGFLPKPYERDDLGSALAQLIGALAPVAGA
jgi:signal transduction histidine kinase/ActR/RegA family two-component response regulator